MVVNGQIWCLSKTTRDNHMASFCRNKLQMLCQSILVFFVIKASRTRSKTCPSRFLPRHLSSEVVNAFWADRPIPQIKSVGLCSQSMATLDPMEWRPNAFVITASPTQYGCSRGIHSTSHRHQRPQRLPCGWPAWGPVPRRRAGRPAPG